MDGEVTTHASLLARLGDGAHSTSWREFHDRYGELICSFARRRGLQAADCADVVQDVLLSLTKAMPGFRYDPRKGKFRSYLKTATVRAIIRRNRQKAGDVALASIERTARDADADTATVEAWETEWRRYHLRIAMRVIDVEFSRSDRQAFQKYAVEGGDVRETAAALTMTVNQVYLAKSRITKRLTDIIELQVREEG